MAHIGVVSVPVYSHISLFLALAQELQKRGHRITFFHMPDVGERIRAEGMEFVPIGESDYPLGALSKSLARLGDLQGWPALRFTVSAIRGTTEMICRDAPAAIRAAGVNLLLVDQTEPAGGTVAEYLGIPFITICSAVAMNREGDIPPPFTPWRFGGSWAFRVRNNVGYKMSDLVLRPMLKVLAEYRRRWGLPKHRAPDDSFSPLAQICQQPAAFDFPRKRLPAWFHYTGPLRYPAASAALFPWEKLDGRPLIYASMGTIVNRRHDVFACFADACRGLDAQLLITLGGAAADPSAVQALAPEALVVSHAPQVEVLARARLTITHGGLNTVLDSLSHGVPLVAIPYTNDQPGTGARVEWTESGRTLPFRKLAARPLREAVEAVLSDPKYATGAGRVRDSIRQAGGAVRAADIVEQVLATGKPAL